jgi:serine/threonine-protein kinase
MPAMAQVTELRGHVLGGKYRLVRAVSEGPRAVYEARHERLAGRFALKQWPATTPWDAFRRGAELALTLRHPGIMQVLDFNCEPGASPFLVLEWIDGTRLSDVIAESGIMPIERVAPLIESAAWALASAHQQGIVHEELRPDEVFVVHAPGTMREWVKLGGFGVSTALAHAGTSPPSRYRAPEQKSGASRARDDDDQRDPENQDGADPQSDQYSLAAIAYEMLAGVPPLAEPRTGAGGRRDEGSRAEPLPISDLAPGVTPAVDAAIRQALAAEPEQRFAGVLEFARALRDAVDGASPESLRRRAAASAPADRRARGAETVSPFFNPLQGRASEVIRRVVSSTARLRTLGSQLGPPLPEGGRFPRGPAGRIALAGTALVLAVTGTAVALRKRAPMPMPTVPAAGIAIAPTAAASSPSPPAVEPETATPTAEPPAPAAALPVIAIEAKTAAEDDEEAAQPAGRATAKQARAAAWARLGSGGARAPGKRAVKAQAKLAIASPGPPAAKIAAPAAKVAAPAAKAASQAAKIAAPTAKPTPSAAPAAKPAAKVAAAPAKAPVAGASGACVISVGSRPPADVWLDDHSLGRRTPLVRFRTACGDHKLALKRTDLDLYQMEIVTLRAGAPFKKVYPLQ